MVIIASTSSGKFAWPDKQSKPQIFPLHSSVIYYISKNPSSSTAYLKLVQSCKYFFEKLPLLVAKDIYEKTKFCPNDYKQCSENEFKCCVIIDLNKISSKIWLTNKISVTEKNNFNYATLLSSKIYRSEALYLVLWNQGIAFCDFKILVSSAIEIDLNNVDMTYASGSNVMLDGILEGIPKTEKIVLYCDHKTFDDATLKNIAKLKNLSNLRELTLFEIPEIKNVEDFFSVIKVHKNAKIHLEFVDNNSEVFKNALAILVVSVTQEKTCKCLIRYHGQDVEKLKIMRQKHYF